MTAEDWKRRSVWTTATTNVNRCEQIELIWTYLEVLGDLTDETLEGELADEELGGLLVAPNFTESDRSGPETVGLLDTSGGGLDPEKNKNKHQQRGGSKSEPHGNPQPTSSVLSILRPECCRTYRRRRLSRLLRGELLTGGLAWKIDTCELLSDVAKGDSGEESTRRLPTSGRLASGLLSSTSSATALKR